MRISSVMNLMDDKPILLFDGVCHLCVDTVQFVIKRDPSQRFRFASLQSSAAEQLLAGYDITDISLDSMILIYKGWIFRKSRAALHTLLLLHRAWPLLAAFLLVPRVIAEPVYDYIGRHRYRWFGKMNACWIPETNQN